MIWFLMVCYVLGALLLFGGLIGEELVFRWDRRAHDMEAVAVLLAWGFTALSKYAGLLLLLVTLVVNIICNIAAVTWQP